MHKNEKECSSGSESENNTWGKAPRGNAEVTKVARYLDNECVFDKEWAFNRMCTLQSLLSARVLQCSSSRNFVSRRRNSAISPAKKKTTGANMLDDKDTKRIQWSYAHRTHDKAENDLTNDRMESSRIRGTQQDSNATGNSEKENSVSSSSQQKYDNSQLSRIEVIKLSKNNAVAGRYVALQRRKQKRWKSAATDAKRKVWEKELIKSKIRTCDHLRSRKDCLVIRDGMGGDEQTRQNRASRNFVVPDLDSDFFVQFERMLWKYFYFWKTLRIWFKFTEFYWINSIVLENTVLLF